MKPGSSAGQAVASSGGGGTPPSGAGGTRTAEKQLVAPGTVASVYALDKGPAEAQIAVKDHVARLAGVHPATVDVHEGYAVSRAQPLTRWPVTVKTAKNGTVIGAAV